jgi:hypothetical protein
MQGTSDCWTCDDSQPKQVLYFLLGDRPPSLVALARRLEGEGYALPGRRLQAAFAYPPNLRPSGGEGSGDKDANTVQRFGMQVPENGRSEGPSKPIAEPSP